MVVMTCLRSDLMDFRMLLKQLSINLTPGPFWKSTDRRNISKMDSILTIPHLS